MKKYKIIITSNTGAIYIEHLKCDNLQDYLNDRSAFRQENYYFDGSLYFAKYIFKIQFQEVG